MRMVNKTNDRYNNDPNEEQSEPVALTASHMRRRKYII